MNRVIDYAAGDTATILSSRDSEIMAFTVANTYLTECADSFSRTKALHKNQQLWSILIKDVMLAQNRLPQSLKDDLIQLACWAMAYSIRAMGAALPLAPLIEVNRDMIEALRRQIRDAPLAPIGAQASERIAV